MSKPHPVLDEVAGATSWYSRQARAVVVGGVVHPIRRTLHLLVDDSGPSLVELAGTDGAIRLGRPGAREGSPPVAYPNGHDLPSRTSREVLDLQARHPAVRSGPPLVALMVTAEGFEPVHSLGGRRAAAAS